MRTETTEQKLADFQRKMDDLRNAAKPATVPAVSGALAAEPPWMARVAADVSEDVVALGREVFGDTALRGYASTKAQGGGEAELARRDTERSAPLPPVSQRPGPSRSTQLDAQIRGADRAIDAFEAMEARVRARKGEA